jgi:hypothetical protein
VPAVEIARLATGHCFEYIVCATGRQRLRNLTSRQHW